MVERVEFHDGCFRAGSSRSLVPDKRSPADIRVDPELGIELRRGPGDLLPVAGDDRCQFYYDGI